MLAAGESNKQIGRALSGTMRRSI
ncbi:hypothetical protein ONQ60_27850 [Salmonella enterica subsp. enterica serovar Virginia]|nr:hypothetical protein [Salmonella enterica subsp. enterica serovar Virginia]